jgi:hypothetical protein
MMNTELPMLLVLPTKIIRKIEFLKIVSFLLTIFISDLAFEKANVEEKLKEKVRRSNNLTVEIQGAVIVTSK